MKSTTKTSTSVDIRDMLFGDQTLENWTGNGSEGIPWTLFRKAATETASGNKTEAVQTLNQILEMNGLESRHYLQACFALRNLGIEPKTKTKIFAVVVEVGMESGCDLLAVYADHTARYYNYSGSAILWDGADNMIAEKIDQILDLGLGIVRQIGPWKDARPPAPKEGSARISFLTSAGLHFGEAPQGVLFKDPTAGPVMHAMLNMMETLINRVNPN